MISSKAVLNTTATSTIHGSKESVQCFKCQSKQEEKMTAFYISHTIALSDLM